ncbi:MAG: hypothetical protein K6E86_06240, partial [Bacteroidales bacterium]|nr:hypothetical protein [Bacteroidales bacterium]
PVNPQQPQGFDPDAKGISVRYNGEAQQIELPETKHAEVSSKAPARKSRYDGPVRMMRADRPMKLMEKVGPGPDELKKKVK